MPMASNTWAVDLKKTEEVGCPEILLFKKLHYQTGAFTKVYSLVLIDILEWRGFNTRLSNCSSQIVLIHGYIFVSKSLSDTENYRMVGQSVVRRAAKTPVGLLDI